MKYFKLSLLITFWASLSGAAVWVDTQTWNEDWEIKYSEFVAQRITTDIFTSPTSPYYGIATDCADLVYFSRAIFSMENSLPFLLNTTWSDEVDKISNRTSRFDHINDLVNEVQYETIAGEKVNTHLKTSLKNGKMRAFLRTLGRDVGTWSLPKDTYPIQINRERVRGGVVFLRQGFNNMSPWELVQTFFTGVPPNPQAPPGHALMVKKVRDTGVVEFIQSTLPKKVRELTQVYEIELLPTNSNLGFRRFLQPQQTGKKKNEELPGFSVEQYFELGRVQTKTSCVPHGEASICDQQGAVEQGSRRHIAQFRKDVVSRLGTRVETQEETTSRLVDSLCGAIRQRAEIIIAAEPLRQKYGSSCMSASDYENYSTPSRDEQIKQYIRQLNFWSRATGRLLSKCGAVPIEQSGAPVPIEELVRNFRRSAFSSNPNEPTSVRWGYESESSPCSKN